MSTNCKRFTSVEDRKRIIRESNRCFNCLRKGHVGSTCKSLSKCKNCGGRHHTSICFKTREFKPSHANKENPNSSTSIQPSMASTSQSRPLDPKAESYNPSTSTAYYTGGRQHILLQTATVHAFNQERPDCKLQLNILMEWQPKFLHYKEGLQGIGSEKVGKKAYVNFGNKKERQERCDIVNLGVETVNNGCVELRLLSVEHICEPIYNSSIDLDQYPYLKQLNLAFDSFNDVPLEIDILLGSDQYWNIMTGEVIRVQNGPTALDTQFGLLKGLALAIM